jgi:peptide/nickel transport system permease protein
MELFRFLIKRTVHGVAVLLAIVTVLFSIRLIYPGDPATLIAAPDATEEVRAAIRAELGLDQPMHIQYLEYLSGILRGDLGTSYQTGTEVTAQIAARLPATLELAVAATIVSLALAIPFGVISATNRNTRLDSVVTTAALVGVSTPNFWFGIILVLLFAVNVPIFPTGGREFGFVESLGYLAFQGNLYAISMWFSQIVLPAVTLGTYYTALLTRLTRNGMLEELGQLYIRATRAKGLSESLVLYKHALRNSLAPLITILGLQVGRLVGGAVVVEEVFYWPGIGRLFINGVRDLDWPMVQGTLLLTAAAIVVANILVDISYTMLNPEVEY